MSYDPDHVIEGALKWMRTRNWHRKIAKSATGQTLLDHTLIEIDVFLAIEAVLANPKAFALTKKERSIILASLLCHDVGKETDPWQSYVRGRSAMRVPHVDPDLLRKVAPEVCRVLGTERLDTEVLRTVELCARYHHSRPERDDATILEALLDGGKSFLALAHIVMDIDRLCSAETAPAVVDYVRRCDLGKHITVLWHQLSIRGVSSAFLHRASQETFSAAGWLPLIYFPDATVYYADGTAPPNPPDTATIQDSLKRILANCIEREVSSLIVGNPTGNILPKPDMVSWKEVRRYLEHAGRRSNPLSFAKKKRESRLTVIHKYLELTGKPTVVDDKILDHQSQRIAHAQPEMVIFKLFKALLDIDKVPALGRAAAGVAAKRYDKVFGQDAWKHLQSTSTLMPAKDMVATIDRYWRLDASTIGRIAGTTVETLPDAERIAGLVTLLDGIIQAVVQEVGAASPRDELAEKMAAAFVQDLVQPSPANSDTARLAQTQAAHYMRSKPIAGTEKNAAAYMCPACNSAFESGRKASADFIDNPQGHTNRGVAHGGFGYIMICNACYYERLVRHILMGTRPAEVITMMPAWNVGPRKGGSIMRGVHEMIDEASREMRGDIGDFSTSISFGLTEQIAARVFRHTFEETRSAHVLQLFRYRFSKKTKRDRLKEAEKRLRNLYAEDLDLLNNICGTTYDSWQAAADGVCAPGEIASDLEGVRSEVLNLFPQMTLVCETPNLIFIPLSNPIAGSRDESDANKALRRLFVALLIHRAFDATVAIHSEPQDIDITSALGGAWVPPVPAIRALIGSDWVAPDDVDTWLNRIAAAARLAQSTGFPKRSAIFQTLVADPAEMIMRRIENEREMVSLEQAEMIRHLPFFRTAGLYEEVLH